MKKNPCKECPFRKTSAPGWLGDLSGQPQVFIDALDHTIIPCHMRVYWDEEAKDTLIVSGEDNPCIGALSFCENSLKYPRAARGKGTRYYDLMEKAVKNPDVFQWSNEFVKHHSI